MRVVISTALVLARGSDAHKCCFDFFVKGITMLRTLGMWSFCALALAGCSGAPSRVSAPPINPNAGADAMTKLDKNADGAIDATEAKGAPAFLEPGSKSRIDANGDAKVTADEITARVKKWDESKIGLTQYSLTLTIDGQPLEGATVNLVPEDWLGTEIKAGSGTTDAGGRVNITIAPADLKPNETGLQGMRLGIYKVQVTHPSIKIPEKYNTATELGVEIAPDDIDLGRTTLALTSR